MKTLFLVCTLVICSHVAQAQQIWSATPQTTYGTPFQTGTNFTDTLPRDISGNPIPTTPTVTPSITYTPLEPLSPNSPATYGQNALPQWLQSAFNVLLSSGALLAVVMLTIAGAMYMFSESFVDKDKARKSINAAVMGLLLLLGAYLILYTINPNLLKFNLNVTATPQQYNWNSTTVSEPPLYSNANALQLTDEEKQNINNNIRNPNAQDCTDARQSLEPSFLKVIASIKTAFTDTQAARDEETRIIRAYVQSCVNAGY